MAAANKTQPTACDVGSYLAAIEPPGRRAEAEWLCVMLARVSGEPPALWGPSIIGYGSYHYKYDSGREGTMCRAGFSPRKAAMTVYLMGTYVDCKAESDALFARLGKHKTGKSCLYINKLADVNLDVLEQLVALSWQCMNASYPE